MSDRKFQVGDWADRNDKDLDPREVIAVGEIDGEEVIDLLISGSATTGPVPASLYDVLPPRGEPQTWRHNRKGLIVGREVGPIRPDSEWMDVRLAGDHDRTAMYAGVQGRMSGTADADEILTVRRSFMTLVES